MNALHESSKVISSSVYHDIYVESGPTSMEESRYGVEDFSQPGAQLRVDQVVDEHCEQTLPPHADHLVHFRVTDVGHQLAQFSGVLLGFSVQLPDFGNDKGRHHVVQFHAGARKLYLSGAHHPVQIVHTAAVHLVAVAQLSLVFVEFVDVHRHQQQELVLGTRYGTLLRLLLLVVVVVVVLLLL